jgi:hypothetical protein
MKQLSVVGCRLSANTGGCGEFGEVLTDNRQLTTDNRP